MRLRPVIALLASLLAAIAAPTAHAQSCEAPPGSAAVEQYCEAIPEGDGSQSGNDFQRESSGSAGSGASSNGPSDGGSPGLSDEAAQALQNGGADGAAVSNLARASRGGEGSSGSSAGAATEAGEVAGTAAQSGEASGSPLRAVSASVENGPVAGSLMIWALLGATLVVLALGWTRFRRTDTTPSTPES